MKSRKSPFMQWIDERLGRDLRFRQQVEEALNEMRLEQDLIALREKRGMSQGQVAKIIGVSQPAIAKIESGRVKNLQLRTVVQYAAALGGKVKVEVVKTGREASPLAERSPAHMGLRAKTARVAKKAYKSTTRSLRRGRSRSKKVTRLR